MIEGDQERGQGMLIPHFHFAGDCKKAIALYEQAFSARVEKVLENDQGLIDHSVMHIHGQPVFLNDRFGNREKNTNVAVHMIVLFDTGDALQACYEIMEPGSIIIDPLEKLSYSELAVQFIDRFGVQWGFMVAGEGM